MRSTRWLCSAMILTVFALAFSAAYAAETEQTDAKTNPNVNLKLADMSVKDGIEALFKDTGLRFQVDPAITGRITELKLEGVRLTDALDAICEAAKLSYSIRDGVYVIVPAARVESTAVQPVTQQLPETAEVAPATQEFDSQAGMESPTAVTGYTQQAGSGQDAQAADQSTQTAETAADGPVYYGQPLDTPLAVVVPSYPPFYDLGNMRMLNRGWGPYVMGGTSPEVMRRNLLEPRREGYVNPEVQRFLDGQRAIRNRTYILPPF